MTFNWYRRVNRLMAPRDRVRQLEGELLSSAELDGVRKHALRQIDESRTESRHWKSEFDRVDAENKSSVVTYRQKASSQDAGLAGAHGRLGAVEESLAASRQRCAQLETALAAARPDAAGADVVPRRIGAGRARGVALIKRRK